jgi:hypothetical protein
MYNRYAESARVNWTLNFAANDPKHKAEWMELMTPKSVGLILRSIKTDYKFVSDRSIQVLRSVSSWDTPAQSRLRPSLALCDRLSCTRPGKSL